MTYPYCPSVWGSGGGGGNIVYRQDVGGMSTPNLGAASPETKDKVVAGAHAVADKAKPYVSAAGAKVKTGYQNLDDATKAKIQAGEQKIGGQAQAFRAAHPDMKGDAQKAVAGFKAAHPDLKDEIKELVQALVDNIHLTPEMKAKVSDLLTQLLHMLTSAKDKVMGPGGMSPADMTKPAAPPAGGAPPNLGSTWN